MATPHKFLRILSIAFRIIAWGALAFGVIGAVGVLLGTTPNTPRPVGFVILVVTGLYFCLFSGLGGIIHLLLILEERTRRTP